MSGRRGEIGDPSDPVVAWLHDHIDRDPGSRPHIVKFVQQLGRDRRSLLRIADPKFRNKMAVLVRQEAHRTVDRRFGRGDTWPDTPLQQRLHNLVVRNFRMVYVSSGPRSNKQKADDR